jgi:hypothetical protein
VHIFPAWLADMIEAEAMATQTPPDLPAMLGLGCLATAAGGRVRAQPRPGWDEPTNLYTAIALDPGNRKSPVFAVMTAPLRDADENMARDSLSEIVAAEARRKVAHSAAAAAVADAAKAKGDDADKMMAEAVAAAQMAEAITVPVQPRLLADDVTPEALGTLMAAQGGRLAILSDEGGIFDLIAGRYSNGGANLDLHLKAWSGSAYRVDRQGRAAEFIPRPALTSVLAVQPDVLRSIADRPGFRGRGLLGRYLYALPLSPLGRRNIDPPRVTDEVAAAYQRTMAAMVQSLAEWRPPDEVVLGFTETAHDVLVRLEAELEPRLGRNGDLGHIADWASKLAGQLVRVATLIHLAANLRTGWRTSVDAIDMAGAAELGDYLIAHALAVFDFMRSDDLTEHCQYVLGWLTDHDRGAFSARDLYTANRYRFPTADALNPVLCHLEALGWIRPQPAEPRDGPGRPAGTVWEVHPRNTT